MPAGRWVVFDTNVYVAALREGVDGPAFARLREKAPRTFIASVVSAELRAGATDQTGRRAVLELADQFDRLGRVVTPDARSWNLAGAVLGEIRRREPRPRAKIASLWNDALIALSARQIGASIVTDNVRDFELLRRFVRFDIEPFAGSLAHRGSRSDRKA